MRHKLHRRGQNSRNDLKSPEIQADVTGRKFEVVENAPNVGTVTSAIVCGVGLGALDSFHKAKDLLRVQKRYAPRPQYRQVYDRSFTVYRQVCKSNRQFFRRLNKDTQ